MVSPLFVYREQTITAECFINMPATHGVDPEVAQQVHQWYIRRPPTDNTGMSHCQFVTYSA